jgi:NTE family protein
MAIRNILCWLGLWVIAASVTTSCESLRSRPDVEEPRQASPQEVEKPPVTETPAEPEPAPALPSEIPKLGIIFGPGGARTYAGIGFLNEMHKYRIPIQAVGGVEWGSLVAGYYALKGSTNDVEWQLNKVKTFEPMDNMGDLKKLFNDTLSRFSVEQIKVPFACPAQNLVRNQTYIMNKGPMNQLLPYCVAFPPVFRAHNSNISGIRELRSLAQYLRSQGANYVILLNVLGAPSSNKNITGNPGSPENLFWNEIAGFYNKPVPGIDQVINLNMDSYSLFDFDRKRDIIQGGSMTSGPWVREFAQKYGF